MELMTKILSIFILMLFQVLVLSQEVKPNAAILIEDRETRYKAFVEFDHFYAHDDNTLLLQHLNN